MIQLDTTCGLVKKTDRIEHYSNTIHHMGVSKNSGFLPQIIHFNKVFHYKPSILGVFPLFWVDTHMRWRFFEFTWLSWRRNWETSKVLRGELEESTGPWQFQTFCYFHTASSGKTIQTTLTGFGKSSWCWKYVENLIFTSTIKEGLCFKSLLQGKPTGESCPLLKQAPTFFPIALSYQKLNSTWMTLKSGMLKSWSKSCE